MFSILEVGTLEIIVFCEKILSLQIILLTLGLRQQKQLVTQREIHFQLLLILTELGF